MKPISVKIEYLISGAILWWCVFAVLSINQYNPFQLLNFVGFVSLSIIPGFLTLFILKLKNLPAWTYIALAVAFSLLEIMITALIINAVLPHLSIARPLDALPLLIANSILVEALALVAYARIGEDRFEFPIKLFTSLKDAVYAFAPSILVALSIFGANRLNNGASNILTIIMLSLAIGYVPLLLWQSKKLSDNAIITGLFFVSAALLLMTSLRGWYVTGPDIQLEYKVFELAKTGGLWDVSVLRDPYNACLSITILPTIFANLLIVADPYVYKFIFQIFFSLCPVLVYLIASLWTNKKVAILSTLYFIGFPTFFRDMPFLIRQEIAFLFYALMLYVIFEERLALWVRRSLFLVFGLGVVLSHYSTTYTLIFIFGSSAMILLTMEKFGMRLFDGIFKQKIRLPRQIGTQKITIWMVLMLLALSTMWTVLITNTESNIKYVFARTITSIQGGFGNNNRSTDALSLLTVTKPDQSSELNDYIHYVVDTRRSYSPDSYYPPETYNIYQYEALDGEQTPYTLAGQFLRGFHIDGGAIVFTFGELIAKLVEVLVPLGAIYILFKGRLVRTLDAEIYWISNVYLLFIAMNIALPVVSTEYGIFRAMQQAMFLIGPIIVVGSLAIGAIAQKVANRVFSFATADNFAMILIIPYLLYSTSLLGYIFGNFNAQLHLSNDGIYYDNDYITENEIFGVNWLSTHIESRDSNTNGVVVDIQTDRYSGRQFASLTALTPDTDIFPGLVKKSAYVFVDAITTQKSRATIIYNSDAVTYTYPLEFLDINKDKIYSNSGGSSIYK